MEENNAAVENNATGKIMDRKLFWKTYLRSLALGAAFNYERMQAIGYCFGMIPALRKLYKTEEEMKEALQRHLGFFNTSPHFVNVVLGVTIAMEEQRAEKGDVEEGTINAVKTALMGPLAAIGDSIFWGSLRIVSAGVGIGLALTGNFLGVLIYILMLNVPHHLLRYYGQRAGYEQGISFLQRASQDGLIEKVTTAVKTLGTFVIGAMIASMVRIETPIVLRFSGTETYIQSVFDGILPRMLPLVLTFFTFWLVKKGIKITTILIGLMIFSILGGVIGLL